MHYLVHGTFAIHGIQQLKEVASQINTTLHATFFELCFSLSMHTRDKI